MRDFRKYGECRNNSWGLQSIDWPNGRAAMTLGWWPPNGFLSEDCISEHHAFLSNRRYDLNFAGADGFAGFLQLVGM